MNDYTYQKELILSARCFRFWISFLGLFIFWILVAGREKLFQICFGIVIAGFLILFWNLFAKIFLKGKYVFSLDLNEDLSTVETNLEDATEREKRLERTVAYQKERLEKQDARLQSKAEETVLLAKVMADIVNTFSEEKQVNRKVAWLLCIKTFRDNNLRDPKRSTFDTLYNNCIPPSIRLDNGRPTPELVKEAMQLETKLFKNS